MKDKLSAFQDPDNYIHNSYQDLFFLGQLLSLHKYKTSFFPLIHHLKNGCGGSFLIVVHKLTLESYETLWRTVILNSAIRQYTQWLCLQRMLYDSSVSAIQYSQFVVGQPTRIMIEVQILTLHSFWDSQ